MRAPWSPAWQPSVSGPLVCDRPFRRIFGVPATASRVEVTHDCHLRSCYCCCCHVRRRLSSHRCQQVWPWCQPNLPPSCAPRSARKRVPPHPSFRPPRHVRESPLPRADESNEKTGLWRRRRPTFLQCVLDGQRDCKIIQTRPFEHLPRLGGPEPCKNLFRHFGKQVCFATHLEPAQESRSRSPWPPSRAAAGALNILDCFLCFTTTADILASTSWVSVAPTRVAARLLRRHVLVCVDCTEMPALLPAHLPALQPALPPAFLPAI